MLQFRTFNLAILAASGVVFVTLGIVTGLPSVSFFCATTLLFFALGFNERLRAIWQKLDAVEKLLKAQAKPPDPKK